MDLDGECSRLRAEMEQVGAGDVADELDRPAGRYSLTRLMRLISPAAQQYLEQMAQQARSLTIQRFGRTIQLYAPLYLSNVCVNSCVYCGYNRTTQFQRTRLSVDEAAAEAEVIANEGFRDILLVSGEDPEFITVDYLAQLVERLGGRFASISVEIYLMNEEQYRRLFAAGIDGVTLYQETYNRRLYAQCHPAGPKSDYNMRIESADRFARAGARRIGLGVLLGLGDWRSEALALGEHACYLMKRYWRSAVSFSFPRLCPARDVAAKWEHSVSDSELVQMMLALRLCFADAGIVLSTRESPALRDHLIDLCVTRSSAGSRTNPGGYTGHDHTARQFEVADRRSPAEVAEVIRRCGRDAVWKDWDRTFTG